MAAATTVTAPKATTMEPAATKRVTARESTMETTAERVKAAPGESASEAPAGGMEAGKPAGGTPRRR